MLNKKAIAAFAAGATLLSGLAFAAPAFAEAAKDAAKTEKTEKKAEECTPATENELLSAKAAIEDDNDDVKTARKELDKAKSALRKETVDNLVPLQLALNSAKAKNDAAKAQYEADKKAADDDEAAYVKAYLAKHDDKSAKDAKEEYNKDQKSDDLTQDQINTRKKLAAALTKSQTKYFGANANTNSPDNPADRTTAKALQTAQTNFDTENDGAIAAAKDRVAAAEATLKAAKDQLKADKKALADLQCKPEAPKPNPVKPNPADPTPVTPGPVTPSVLPNVAQASGVLMHANVAYNESAAVYGTAFNELKDAQAKYDAAETQLNSLNAQVKAANDNYQNNFVLAGKADTDAGKAAKADLDNAVALAQAYASHEYADAKKTRDEKKAKLDKAGKALNAAKAQYANAYLAAVKVEASAVKGFPDPRNLADAPVDVFSPEGKAAAGKLAAAAAQAGKTGAAAAANGAAAAAGAKAAAGENGGKKKNNAGENAKKKLGQTGATVALAAVAASVLAGVGAALRKIRH